MVGFNNDWTEGQYEGYRYLLEHTVFDQIEAFLENPVAIFESNGLRYGASISMLPLEMIIRCIGFRIFRVKTIHFIESIFLFLSDCLNGIEFDVDKVNANRGEVIEEIRKGGEPIISKDKYAGMLNCNSAYRHITVQEKDEKFSYF